MENTIDDLRSKLAVEVKSYSEAGMMEIKNYFQGIAFFPGGNGLFLENGHLEFPNEGVMILGQDFGSEKDIAKDKNQSEIGPTWKIIKDWLSAADIPKEKCFFTNAIMGVRKLDTNINSTKSSNTGPSPAFKHNPFIEQCQSFFKEQLQIQKPNLVVVLGKQVVRFLNPLSSKFKKWHGKTFNEIDKEKNGAFITDVLIGNHSSNFLLLSHPSLSHLSEKYRKAETNTALLRYAYDNEI